MIFVVFLLSLGKKQHTENGKMMQGKFLETMHWKEAEQALKDYNIVVIPIGARLKEHGLHLPLNNDWILAEYLTNRIVEQCRVLAIPTVQYGYYPAFLEYPGSVHITRETSSSLIVDICRSFSRHGMQKFYVLNTGVSTNWALEPARKQLGMENIVMEYTNLLKMLRPIEEKISEQEGGSHADEVETSMMQYISPEIVKQHLAKKDYHGPQKGPLTRDPDNKNGVYSPTGAFGDPTKATVEKGRIIVEAFVSALVLFLQKFSQEEFVPTPFEERFLR